MLTVEQQQYILDNYKAIPYPKIAAHLGITKKRVFYFAEKSGLKKGKGYHSAIYKVNERYFHKWSHDMAYLLGFILADGCVFIKDNRFRLIIGLQKRDMAQVEWIRNELAPDKPIQFNVSNQSYSFRVDSKTLIKQLIKLGIHPNKSYNDVVPSVPQKYKMDFLRGVFDGDGCLYVRARQKGKYISKDCRWQITAKLASYLQNLMEEVSIQDGSIVQCNRWYVWQIHNHQTIIELCKKIYKNTDKSYYLKRKYEKYQELIRLYE